MATVDPRALRRQERARRTGSAGSSSTTCATASAPPPPAPGRRARGRASASRCPAPGTSSARSPAARTGRSAASHERIEEHVDPWRAYAKTRQTLAKARKSCSAPDRRRAAVVIRARAIWVAKPRCRVSRRRATSAVGPACRGPDCPSGMDRSRRPCRRARFVHHRVTGSSDGRRRADHEARVLCRACDIHASARRAAPYSARRRRLVRRVGFYGRAVRATEPHDRWCGQPVVGSPAGARA